MKKVDDAIKVKKGSDLWNLIKERENLDPEKEAQKAADFARKKAQAELDEREIKRKAYLDSLCYYEKLEFANQDLRSKIEFCCRQYEKLQSQAGQESRKSKEILKELQEKCSHDMSIEKRTTYTDEYDQWHDGHFERKCIECFLVEKSDYLPSDRSFAYGHKKYVKLLKSKVVLLRKTINGEVYEIEFDDLKW